jgi:hypothetical protein
MFGHHVNEREHSKRVARLYEQGLRDVLAARDVCGALCKASSVYSCSSISGARFVHHVPHSTMSSDWM